MHLVNLISSFLLVLGSLHVGLVNVLNVDIITSLFGSFGGLVDIIYALIGLSAIHYIMQGKLFPVD